MTQEELKSIVSYNPETGVFTNRKTWRVIGHKDRGYVVLHLAYNNTLITYKAHRLAWLYVYGYTPKMLDHINGDRADNRIANLRLTTDRENACNRKMHREGKLPGCFLDKRYNKWQAQLRINGKNIPLGMYADQRSAHEAYLAALKEVEQGNVPDVTRHRAKKI